MCTRSTHPPRDSELTILVLGMRGCAVLQDWNTCIRKTRSTVTSKVRLQSLHFLHSPKLLTPLACAHYRDDATQRPTSSCPKTATSSWPILVWRRS